jgi:hypothetical protein
MELQARGLSAKARFKAAIAGCRRLRKEGIGLEFLHHLRPLMRIETSASTA